LIRFYGLKLKPVTGMTASISPKLAHQAGKSGTSGQKNGVVQDNRRENHGPSINPPAAELFGAGRYLIQNAKIGAHTHVIPQDVAPGLLKHQAIAPGSDRCAHNPAETTILPQNAPARPPSEAVDTSRREG